jgi:outer membrane biosynthesis protein TonB
MAFFGVILVTPVTFPERPDLLRSTVRKTTNSSISGTAIMRKWYVLAFFLLFLTFFGPARMAQSQQSASLRRITRQVAPVYPDVAKKINLGGTVKVIAVVGADGDVKSVEPVGGSPVLLKAAQDAVAKWKYAPGGESRESVELHFTP